MVRRKPIGISSRLGSSNSSLLNSIIKYEDIIEQANALRDTQAEQAYVTYNAGMYPNMINVQPTVVEPIVYPTKEVALSGNAHKSKKIKYDGNKNKFVSDIYDSYYKAVRPGAASDKDAARQAKFLTQKAAFETGYGRSIANTHNYGGHRNKSGWLAFSSMDDFTKKDVALLDRKWSNWRTANNETDFVNAITTNRGAGAYAPRQEYQGYIGMNNDINQRLNMSRRRLRCGGQVNRPKAFLGAVIGAFGSIANSLIQGSQQEEMARRQQEAEDRRYYSQLAANMSTVLNNRDAQEAYEKQFRMAYKNGGRRRLRQGINITDGGYAIPMGENTFLLRGGSHEDINETGQTGIGINVNGKEIEGENGEVVQKKPDEVRIFSDTIGINGNTFADLVQMGYNKDKLFKIQQNMNGDYGRRRMRNGGYLTRPVGRIIAARGLRERLGQENSLASRFYNWLDRRYDDVRRALYGRVSAPPAKKTTTGTRAANYAAQNGPFYSSNNTNIARGNLSTVNTNNNVSSSPSIATGGVRGNNTRENNTPVRTSWIGRDGRRYYGTVTRGENGNTYKIDKVENTNKVNTQLAVKKNTISTNYKNNRNTNIPSNFGSTPTTTTASNSTRFPINYINVGVSAPSLGNYNVSTPSLDTTIFGNNFASVGNTPATSTPSRRTSVGTRSGRSSASSRPSLVTNNSSVSSNTVNLPGSGTDLNIRGSLITPALNATVPTTPIVNNNVTPINLPGSGTDPNVRQTLVNNIINGNSNTQPVISQNNRNKLGMVTKGADWIQLGADTIGSLIGGLANLNTANNMVMPREPAPIQAVKLPTTYSIGADLADNNRVVNEMLRDSRNNISSSMALNTMRNRIRLAGNDRVNSLYQTRSRAENEMLTADAKNQQDIAIRNAMIDADYQARLNEAQNRRALLRGNAYSTMLSGLSDAVGNFIDQGKQRYSDQQAMNYYMALLPEEGRNWLRRNRVDFLRKGGRIK